MGCSLWLFGSLDALRGLAGGVQKLFLSLAPEKRQPPPFLRGQALAGQASARELPKLAARVQARERGNPRVTAPFSRHRLAGLDFDLLGFHGRQQCRSVDPRSLLHLFKNVRIVEMAQEVTRIDLEETSEVVQVARGAQQVTMNSIAQDGGEQRTRGAMHWTSAMSTFVLRHKGFKEVHLNQVAKYLQDFTGNEVTGTQEYNH
uniref:Uncharacterized protein n=1 Tax=Oryza punctata TaxID=4537 RepID=A0A0E0KMJ1_ORYPU